MLLFALDLSPVSEVSILTIMNTQMAKVVRMNVPRTEKNSPSSATFKIKNEMFMFIYIYIYMHTNTVLCPRVSVSHVIFLLWPPYLGPNFWLRWSAT